jgi:hypothetical protein
MILNVLLLLLYCQISAVLADDNQAPIQATGITPAPAPASPMPVPTTSAASTTEKLRDHFIPSAKPQNTPKTVEDPTQANANFRAAMNQLNSKSTSAPHPATNTAPALSMPTIKLLALACSHHKDKNHAMLSINGKSEMLGAGEKTTTLVNNQVVEIEVLEVEKNYVRLQLHPNNQTIILH